MDGKLHTLLCSRQLHGITRGPALLGQRDLESWAEQDFLDNCSPSYVRIPTQPRSTIATAFSPNGVYLAATHGDHTVKVFKCATGECVRVFTGHVRTPWVVRWHPSDSSVLASGSLDCQVRVWHMKTGSSIESRLFSRAIASVAFVPGNPDVLAIAAGHKVYMWEYAKGQQKDAVAVLRTRRSLRAIHFPAAGEGMMLTAELVDPQPTSQLPAAVTQPEPDQTSLFQQSAHPTLQQMRETVPTFDSLPSVAAAGAVPYGRLSVNHTVRTGAASTLHTPSTANGSAAPGIGGAANSFQQSRPHFLPRSISAHGTLYDADMPWAALGSGQTGVFQHGQQQHRTTAVVSMPRASSVGSLPAQLPRVPSTHGFALPESPDVGRGGNGGVSGIAPFGSSYTPSFPRVSSSGSALLTLPEEELPVAAGPGAVNMSGPRGGPGHQSGFGVGRSLLCRGMFRRPSAFAAAAAQAPAVQSSQANLAASLQNEGVVRQGDSAVCATSMSRTSVVPPAAMADTPSPSRGSSSHGSRLASEDGGAPGGPGSQGPGSHDLAATPLASTLSMDEDVFGEGDAVEDSPQRPRHPLQPDGIDPGDPGSGSSSLQLQHGGHDMQESAPGSRGQMPRVGSGSLVRSAPLPIRHTAASHAPGAGLHRWPMFQAQYAQAQDANSSSGLAAAQGDSPAPLVQELDRAFMGSGLNSSVSVLSQQLAQMVMQQTSSTDRQHDNERQEVGSDVTAAAEVASEFAAVTRAHLMPRSVSAVTLSRAAPTAAVQTVSPWMPRSVSAGPSSALPTSMVTMGPELPAYMLPHLAAAAGLPQLPIVAGLEEAGTDGELTLQERSCRVCLRLWRFDAAQPTRPVTELLMSVEDAMLCSEMGVHFAPDGSSLVVCTARSAPAPLSGPGAPRGPGPTPIPMSQGMRQTVPVTNVAPSPPVAPLGDTAPQLVYELRVLSLAPKQLGHVLCARRIKAAHCLTSLQVSPTSEHVLLAYGRRHLSLLRSLMADANSITPVHTVVEVYKMADLSLRCVLPSAEDEVNAACFHPHPGGGMAYGTKTGRLRLVRRDRGHHRTASAAAAAAPPIVLEDNLDVAIHATATSDDDDLS